MKVEASISVDRHTEEGLTGGIERVTFTPTKIGSKAIIVIPLMNNELQIIRAKIIFDSNKFQVYPKEIVLNPKEHKNLFISFTPSQQGTWVGHIKIIKNEIISEIIVIGKAIK